MADFDPYYVWLGIPPKNQPPDHYRLLGIEAFEPDLRVIESAADRQMAHVKTFQTGKNGADSQRVLNHLSQARQCLLNPQQKAAYDANLRHQMPITPPGLPQPPGVADPPMAIPIPFQGMPPQAMPYRPVAASYAPPPGTFPMAIPAAIGAEAPPAAPSFLAPSSPVDTFDPTIHRPPKKGFSPAAMIAGVVGLLGLAAAAAVLSNASTPKPVPNVAKSSQTTTTTPNKKPRSDPTIPDQGSQQAVSSEPNETKAGSPTEVAPTIETVPPSEPERPTNDTTTQPSSPATETSVSQPPKNFAEAPSEPLVPAGPAVSVLNLIPGQPMQGGGVSSGGQWEMVQGKLRGVNGGTLLPIVMPSDYQLDIQIEHIADTAHLNIGFPVVGRAAAVTLNWHVAGKTFSGLSQLDGADLDRNESTYQEPVFSGDKSSHVRVVVRGNFIQVLVNDKAIIQWRGDPSRLNLSAPWRYPGKDVLCLGLGAGDALISSIEMTPLQPLPVAARRQPLFVLAPAKRLDAHSSTKLQAGRTAAKKLFVKELAAAKTPLAKRDLAKAMFARAREDKDEVAVRLALWQETQNLAASNLDALLACQAIDQQAKLFDVDALALRTKALEETVKDVDANTPMPELRNVVEATCVTIDKVIAAERFDLTKRLTALLKRLSQHKKFPAHKEYATKRIAEFAWASDLSEAAQKSSGNDSPEAQEAAGRYACFVQGNWSKGLPLLAAGSDGGLASIAKLELEVRSAMAPDEEKYRQLADAWWESSTSAEEPWAQEYRRQARYWYEQIPQRLSAPEIQERINSASEIANNRFAPGLLAACYVGDQYGILRLTRIDKNVARSWQTGSPDASIPGDNFAVVWTGTIRAAIPGKYFLSVNSDDGSRMDLDGKTLWDDFGGGSGVRGVEVELTGEPQRMVLYFHEGIVHAHCTLRWRLGDETEDRIVDGQFLRHDPLLAKKFRATDVVGNYVDTVDVPSAPEGGLLAIFEDQPELPASLPEDFGPMELEYDDRYSGEASLRIGGQQRFGFDSMGIRARIREKPGPGEYRYARFAWKKVGGGPIALQFHGTLPTGKRNWRRYHIGPNKNEFPFWGGSSIGISEEVPSEWTVVTRDLFADYGEFDLTGLALTVFQNGYGLFDHIYLARTVEDFEKLGEVAGTPLAGEDTESSGENSSDKK